MREKTIVVLPDTQVPYHDEKYTDALIRFVADYEPDELAHVGDHLDAPEPSRWNKGMAGEYAPTLQAGIDVATQMLVNFKNALGDKPFHFKVGNHDERVETYVSRYAPALSSIDALRIESLLKTEENGITVHRGLYDLAPGWVLAHLHETGLNRTAGGTAMGLARKIGKSVVGGHTHKAGIQSEAHGYNGKVSQIFGMEVGHAMDIRKAGYLKYGGASWTQAFGILHVHKGFTTPELVIVQGRTFKVDGQVYKF